MYQQLCCPFFKYHAKLPPRPYIIGLTGGIGSGKSSVCRRLHGQGAAIVDCDKLGMCVIPGDACVR